MPDNLRISEIYAWTDQSPDGLEGVIATSIPILGNMVGPLQHRDYRIAMLLKPIAQAHKRTHPNSKVRLIKLTYTETLEEF